MFTYLKGFIIFIACMFILVNQIASKSIYVFLPPSTPLSIDKPMPHHQEVAPQTGLKLSNKNFSSTTPQQEKQENKLHLTMYTELMVAKTIRPEVDANSDPLSYGARFSIGFTTPQKFYTGIGIGGQMKNRFSALDLGIDFRIPFTQSSSTSYAGFSMGYSYLKKFAYTGGIYLYPTLGFIHYFNRHHALLLGIGYKIQEVKFDYMSYNPAIGKMVQIAGTRNLEYFTLNLGFIF